jgi:hypothetical protein
MRDSVWQFTSGAATDVTPAGYAAWAGTSAAPIFALSFAGELVVARDGAIPQRLTGLGGTPTMAAISLNAAGTETTTGMPTIYSGRVFFPITSERSTFVWSEPGSAALGYQQTGYANAWRFAQTSNAPLLGLWGTNSRLLVVRQGSIAAVYGQTDTQFATTATSDDVASGIGNVYVTLFVQVDDETWFVDGFGHVRVIPASGRASDPIAGMSWLRSCFSASQLLIARFGAAYDADTGTVLFQYPTVNARVFARWTTGTIGRVPTPLGVVAVNARSRRFIGLWSNAVDINDSVLALGMSNGRALAISSLGGTSWTASRPNYPELLSGPQIRIATRPMGSPDGVLVIDTVRARAWNIATADGVLPPQMSGGLVSAMPIATTALPAGVMGSTVPQAGTSLDAVWGTDVRGRQVWAYMVVDLDPTQRDVQGLDTITLTGFVDAPEPEYV